MIALRYVPLPLLFFFCAPSVLAQMWNGVDSLAGNEWIDFSKTYYKIQVATDGVYRLDYAALQNAGFPVGSVSGQQFRLYLRGAEVPIFTSADGAFGPADYVEFYGEANRGELDAYLFSDAPAQNLNPRYSLVNDTAAYFLTWSTMGTGLRYAPIDNELSALPAPEAFVWQTAEAVFSDDHLKREISSHITYSWYDGNGFGSARAASSTFTLPVSQAMTGGPAATATIRYGTNLGPHQQQIAINDSILATDSYSGFAVRQHDFFLPAAMLGSGTLKFQVQGLAPGGDQHTIAIVRARYARLPAFDGAAVAVFELEAAAGKRYLELGDFAGGGAAPILYDLTNRLRLQTTVENGIVKAVLPPSATTRKLIVLQPDGGLLAASVQQGRQFRPFAAENASFVIISNRTLYNDPANGGADHVQAYADYRASAAGGGHTVAVIDIEELYDQFAYGVRFHPLSIRNFAFYIDQNWNAAQHILLIGKGLEYPSFRTTDQQGQQANILFYLPVIGHRGSDLLYVMPGYGVARPRFGIGRLPVRRAEEIKWYLDKVKSHEQQLANAAQSPAEKAWLKRALHISGGLAAEQAAIAAYAGSMATELQTNMVGAQVTTLYKTSNDPVQTTEFERVQQAVNQGVSTWMIFGHSSETTIDFDIGNGDDYANKDRYPLMLIMGCNSGVCSQSFVSLGEEFVLVREKGALAYLATVNYSFIDGLYAFGNRFYEHLGGADYTASLGEMVANTIGSFEATNYPSLVAILHQIQLQGDPAVRLHNSAGPDYLVDPSTVNVSPNPVSIDAGSYAVDFNLLNLGKNVTTPLAVRIEQQLPDNSVRPLRVDTVPAPAFSRPLHLTLPAAGTPVGFSRLLITVDPANTVAESPAAGELNNELLSASGQKGVEVYFYTSDVRPVWPTDFGIVRQGPVRLYASSLSLQHQDEQRFLFELDTTDRFDSPLRQSTTLLQPGGLLSWQPNLAWTDSTVYYWRVARDSLGTGEVAWRDHSFMFLTGSSPGWNASHYQQYAKSSFVTMQVNRTQKRLEFADDLSDYFFRAAYWNPPVVPAIRNKFDAGFDSPYGWASLGGMDRGIALMLFDPDNLKFFVNPPGSPSNPKPNEPSILFRFFPENPSDREALMDFIENDIPPYTYVGLVTIYPYSDTVAYDAEAWGADSLTLGRNLFQVLEAQGARDVRRLALGNGTPPAYGLAFQKSNPAFAVDTIVVHPDSTLTMRREFFTRWLTGSLETPPIGPASSWTSLHWQPGPKDHPSETARLALLGVRPGQPDSVLWQGDAGIDLPLTNVAPADFPFLKMRYSATDSTERTATQLRYARILYEGLPEGALHPVAHTTFHRDTLERGEPMRASMAFANVSDRPLDSVLVKFRLENDQGGSLSDTRRFKPLPPGDTLHAGVRFDTRTLNGPYRWSIDVNPDQDQPEQFHFNNVAFREVYVRPDERNPLLDVTFDGMHILNGDIVSPRPFIVVTLKDDSRFLALNDTALFRLILVRPDGRTGPVYFADPTVQFFPAEAGQLPQKNRARIEWQPEFTLDGDYELRVQGRDASGNASGHLDYTIRFSVINRSSISNVLNYPNPFSTSTCFVYTMTGAETPADFRIQIMTVSGRVVREITAAEFGPLRAGTHRSDYCWDGHDEYGDQLANGVYLYRVVAKKPDGSAFESFAAGAIDGFFKGGLGKMVLMR